VCCDGHRAENRLQTSTNSLLVQIHEPLASYPEQPNVWFKVVEVDETELLVMVGQVPKSFHQKSHKLCCPQLSRPRLEEKIFQFFTVIWRKEIRTLVCPESEPLELRTVESCSHVHQPRAHGCSCEPLQFQQKKRDAECVHPGRRFSVFVFVLLSVRSQATRP